jgi:hypothetical protein
MRERTRIDLLRKIGTDLGNSDSTVQAVSERLALVSDMTVEA